MAGFADTLEGDGLARVQRALDRLEADPLGLDRARMRFSQPPPSYKSNPSGTTTRTESELPSDEQRRKERRDQRFERRRKLMDERAASLPLQQFHAQKDEEMRRLWNTNPRTNWMSDSHIPVQGLEEKEAIQTVKKRWVEQGIWKDHWDEMAAGRYFNIGRWKHEEPIELESESETDTVVESPPTFSLFGGPPKQPPPKPKRLKSNDENLRVAERRAVREREREASRPYYQFIYQISKERERIQDESVNGEGADAADINTRAYENVKNTWTKRGIWNERWAILPGMLWKHEEPREEETPDTPVPVPADENGSRDAREAPTIRLFGSPSSVTSNHRQTSGIMDTSPQGPCSDVAEPQPSPDHITPRRSKRIKPPVPSVAEDLARTGPTVPTKRAVRSKMERKVATRSSAKPQGISKRQPAKTARGKARKI